MIGDLRAAAVAVCQLWFTDNAPDGSPHIRKAMLDLREALDRSEGAVLVTEATLAAAMDDVPLYRFQGTEHLDIGRFTAAILRHLREAS